MVGLQGLEGKRSRRGPSTWASPEELRRWHLGSLFSVSDIFYYFNYTCSCLGRSRGTGTLTVVWVSEDNFQEWVPLPRGFWVSNTGPKLAASSRTH